MRFHIVHLLKAPNTIRVLERYSKDVGKVKVQESEVAVDGTNGGIDSLFYKSTVGIKGFGKLKV